MSAESAALMHLVAAERELAEAVSLLGETEDDRLPTEHYANLCRALKEVRQGAEGFGMMMTVRGLERVGRGQSVRRSIA